MAVAGIAKPRRLRTSHLARETLRLLKQMATTAKTTESVAQVAMSAPTIALPPGATLTADSATRAKRNNPHRYHERLPPFMRPLFVGGPIPGKLLSDAKNTVDQSEIFTLYTLDAFETPLVESLQMFRGAKGEIFEHTAPPPRCTILELFTNSGSRPAARRTRVPSSATGVSQLRRLRLSKSWQGTRLGYSLGVGRRR
jgi:hypothetical protein